MKEKIESLNNCVKWINTFCLLLVILNWIQCERLGDIKKELKILNERVSIQKRVGP